MRSVHLKLVLLNDKRFKHSFVLAYVTTPQSAAYLAPCSLTLASIQRRQCLRFLTCKKADNHMVGKEDDVRVVKNGT